MAAWVEEVRLLRRKDHRWDSRGARGIAAKILSVHTPFDQGPGRQLLHPAQVPGEGVEPDNPAEIGRQIQAFVDID
eukprot:7563750-Pyramimonas_sp.AAC.1